MSLHEQPGLRDRVRVFRDRTHAGEVVAGMLGELRGSDTTVLAIPAGGVPVGAAIASALALPLDVAVVSKITLPWNTEVGYGAVAFDGTVRLNEELVRGVGLAEEEIRRGVEATMAKVRRRVAEELAARVDALYCANVRGGFGFAVADAYRHWCDVDESEAREILARSGGVPRGPC